MKYIGIFIGLFVLSFIVFNLVALVTGATTNEVEMVALIVLCIQNITIITLLIYIAQRLRKK
ncbi:hypothetical protein [Bacillus sinesaloumensis]|uniref:hypothetical protein n=1 Tax=Litchfieldia sinesaloumensis TaxID=1926280 RepID=UPI0009884A21|nr:hypothetical protein [Bacillus sinesaloumensis]